MVAVRVRSVQPQAWLSGLRLRLYPRRDPETSKSPSFLGVSLSTLSPASEREPLSL